MNILITGGASGLGKSITQKLASNSEDKVYFTFHKSTFSAKEIEVNYNNTSSIQCDFTNAKEFEAFLTLIKDLDIDILINNAFATEITLQHFHKIDVSLFVNNFLANIVPTILITQQMILNFRKKKSGKIINILSSYLIDNPPIGCSEYVAGKAYLN